MMRDFDPTSVELRAAGEGAPTVARTRAIAELERLSGQGSIGSDLAELLRTSAPD